MRRQDILIKFQTENGIANLKVPMSFTIAVLKNEIARLLTIDSQLLSFRIGDKKLVNDAEPLSANPSLKDSMIKVTRRSLHKLKIFLKTKAHTTRPVEINNRALVSKLKLKVYEITGLKPADQQLVFGARILEDSLSLADYSITAGSIIDVEIKPPIIILTIHLCDGRMLSFKVPSTMAIGALKPRVSEKCEKPVYQIRILRDHEELSDDKSFADYGLSDKATLRVSYPIVTPGCSDGLCKVCYEREANTLLLPCSHNITCTVCTLKMNTCPYCQRPIQQAIPCYRC